MVAVAVAQVHVLRVNNYWACQLLKRKVETRSLILRNAVIMKILPGCLNCSFWIAPSVWIAIACLIWIELRKEKLLPKSNNLTNEVIFGSIKIRFPNFQLTKVSELLWLHLFSELLGYRPSMHNEFVTTSISLQHDNLRLQHKYLLLNARYDLYSLCTRYGLSLFAINDECIK